MMSLGLADFEMSFKDYGDGVIVRIMKFKFCYKKNIGIGDYDQSVTDGNTVETCPIVWILIYLQVVGAIPSAIDVYNGKAQIHIDSSIYESCDILKSKLKRAEATLRKKQIEYLTCDDNEDDDGTSMTLMQQVIKTEDPVVP